MQKIFYLCIKSFNKLAKVSNTRLLKDTKLKRQKERKTGLFIQTKVKNIRVRVWVTQLHSNHFMFLNGFPVSKQVLMETEEK